MVANSVAPPSSGTTRAESSEHSAGTGLNELSLCQSMLAFWYSMRLSSDGMTSPVSTSMFDWRAKAPPPPELALTVFSSGPKRSLKAIWRASSRLWSRKSRTEYSSNASRIAAKVSSFMGLPVSTPTISAP